MFGSRHGARVAAVAPRKHVILPVAKAIVAKMVVNERRSYRHGKRF